MVEFSSVGSSGGCRWCVKQQIGVVWFFFFCIAKVTFNCQWKLSMVFAGRVFGKCNFDEGLFEIGQCFEGNFWEIDFRKDI